MKIKSNSSIIVFHGTSKKAAEQIIEHGFDPCKARRSDFITGDFAPLGVCTYFAFDKFKASHLSRRKFGKDAVLMEYKLNTGEMKTVGSYCFDWQADYDTCYLVGQKSKRESSVPKGTLVSFDEIGVSFRVLNTHLEFQRLHEASDDKPFDYKCGTLIKWNDLVDLDDHQSQSDPIVLVMGEGESSDCAEEKKIKQTLPDEVRTSTGTYVASEITTCSSKDGERKVEKLAERQSSQDVRYISNNDAMLNLKSQSTSNPCILQPTFPLPPTIPNCQYLALHDGHSYKYYPIVYIPNMSSMTLNSPTHMKSNIPTC